MFREVRVGVSRREYSEELIGLLVPGAADYVKIVQHHTVRIVVHGNVSGRGLYIHGNTLLINQLCEVQFAAKV